jgi:hypothetical protein
MRLLLAAGFFVAAGCATAHDPVPHVTTATPATHCTKVGEQTVRASGVGNAHELGKKELRQEALGKGANYVHVVTSDCATHPKLSLNSCVLVAHHYSCATL